MRKKWLGVMAHRFSLDVVFGSGAQTKKKNTNPSSFLFHPVHILVSFMF
jgi:hypothetical protein